MVAQSKSNRDVRTITQDESIDESAMSITLSLNFLHERIVTVETKISRWESYLEHHYPHDNPLPRGDAGRLPTYEIELALLRQLINDSQTLSFVTAHRQQLMLARQRVQQLVNKGNLTPAQVTLKAERYQAWVEQELLIELWVKWRVWLQSYRERNSPKGYA